LHGAKREGVTAVEPKFYTISSIKIGVSIYEPKGSFIILEIIAALRQCKAYATRYFLHNWASA
jgi:hypothetical protein